VAQNKHIPKPKQEVRDMKKSVLAITAVLVLGGAYLLMNKDESANRTEGVYAYVPTTDGKTIPIPYSRPDKAEYVVKQAAHFRDVPTSSATIGIGSQAVIPGWKWVDVANKNPITQRFSNGSKKLVVGETCGVEFGGLITVAEVRGENLFVEYTAPGNPAGTPCPSGVQFIVSKTNFATMNGQYTATRDSIQAEKELVKRLLAQNYYSEPTNAGNWHWVDVVNLDPVVQNFSNGHGYLAYGETCGAGRSDYGDGHVVEGGTIRVRGEANGKVLYEYTARGNPMGTPCPSGILFFGRN